MYSEISMYCCYCCRVNVPIPIGGGEVVTGPKFMKPFSAQTLHKQTLTLLPKSGAFYFRLITENLATGLPELLISL